MLIPAGHFQFPGYGMDGRYLVNGFCNRDIGKVVFPGMRDAKKLSSRTSRTLKKLRPHGLIKKVPCSRRYHVTSKGRRIMGVLIELYKTIRFSGYQKNLSY